MTNKRLFIISDLHLGGGEGFQMCSSKEKLSEFINWVTQEVIKDKESQFNLVLAGDIIDFLAEEEWKAFTKNEDDAVRKIEQVFENFRNVWNAFRNYLASEGTLTILLGNHDIEMCLPKVRQRLLQELGNGKIEFLYDNQAFVVGDVIIEHGNRYDPWNTIDHDALRQIRSALSRKESIKNSLQVPGSILVENVMNPIKKIYPFIDLLKPEDAAVALLVSVLEPSKYALIKKVVKPAFLSTRAKYNDAMMPINPENIAGQNLVVNEFEDLDLKLQEIVGFSDANIASVGFQDILDTLKGFGKVLLSNLSRSDEERVDQLYKGFKYVIKKHNLKDTGQLDSYEIAAKSLSSNFRVIVFGHTHKAKKIEFSDNQSTYFNSGTWADVILLPKSLFEDDEEIAKRDLIEFMRDMLHKKNFQKWIKQRSTFVEIYLDEQDESIKSKSGIYNFLSKENPREQI